MSETDTFNFFLEPNHPADDPAIAQAVQLFLWQELEKQGIHVKEPGNVEVDAAENTARANSIVRDVAGEMAKVAAESRAASPALVDLGGAVVAGTDEQRIEHADGRVETRVRRIIGAGGRMRVDLSQLKELLDSTKSFSEEVREWVKEGIGLCVMLVLRIRAKAGTGKGGDDEVSGNA